MIIKQLSIFVENKPGRLAEITQILRQGSIDIRALCIADTRDFGILRLIVNNPEKAAVLLQEHQCTVSLTDVIAIGIVDEPGGLAGPMQVLFESGISVEYMYAFISKDKDAAYVILRVEDNEKAIAALTEKGIRVVPSEEVYHM